MSEGLALVIAVFGYIAAGCVLAGVVILLFPGLFEEDASEYDDDEREGGVL